MIGSRRCALKRRPGSVLGRVVLATREDRAEEAGQAGLALAAVGLAPLDRHVQRLVGTSRATPAVERRRVRTRGRWQLLIRHLAFPYRQAATRYEYRREIRLPLAACFALRRTLHPVLSRAAAACPSAGARRRPALARD